MWQPDLYLPSGDISPDSSLFPSSSDESVGSYEDISVYNSYSENSNQSQNIFDGYSNSSYTQMENFSYLKSDSTSNKNGLLQKFQNFKSLPMDSWKGEVWLYSFIIKHLLYFLLFYYQIYFEYQIRCFLFTADTRLLKNF